MSNERFIEMPEVVCKMAEGNQPVREMTVEEVAKFIINSVNAGLPTEEHIGMVYGYKAAKALAKLGTIRIVGDK